MSTYAMKRVHGVRGVRTALFIWLLLPAASVWAAGTSGGAAPYLREGIGARALAMGNAHAAESAGAAAVYWNPAGLAFNRGAEIGSHVAALGDQRQWTYLGYALAGENPHLGNYGLGAGWIHFSAGNDLEARTANRPVPDRIFSDNQNAFLLGAAATWGSSTAFGSTVKVVQQTLDEEGALGFGIDLGLAQTYADWAWGVSVQDLYTTLDWSGRHSDRLPTLTRAGASWQAVPDQLRLNADLVFEWSHAGQGLAETSFRVGSEYRPWEQAAVRAGLDRDRFTAGAGIGFSLGMGWLAVLDYALALEHAPGGGMTHLFSLKFQVEEGKTDAW